VHVDTGDVEVVVEVAAGEDGVLLESIEVPVTIEDNWF
jgi:hypothetical protein